MASRRGGRFGAIRRISHLTGGRDQTNRSGRRSNHSPITRAGVSTLLLFEDKTTVAKPELGAKRQCQSCATRFYDLHKDPILCPKCGATFHVAPLARAPSRAAEPEREVEKEEPETISLTEVEDAENKVEASDADVDVEIEDEAEADDTFLEVEEGEDDDVAGLIDGDIAPDEET
jgi:uncharacterized protein (TIGR02300 family)